MSFSSISCLQALIVLTVLYGVFCFPFQTRGINCCSIGCDRITYASLRCFIFETLLRIRDRCLENIY